MLQLIIKIGLLIVLMAICSQDFKERKVYVGLFVLALCMLTVLHISEVSIIQFFMAIFINVSIVLMVMAVLLLFSRWVLKTGLENTFGLGDFFFFLIMASAFPTGTFLVVFSSSLIGSLCLYVIVKNKLQDKTVPLAGLQALIVGLLLGFNWMFNFTDLYLI